MQYSHQHGGLRAGVTTVRDLGGRSGTTLALRDAINRGLLPGPRVMAYRLPITLTGEHCYFLRLEADTEDEVRRAVRWQVKQGVDGIKIMSTGGRMTPGTNPVSAQYSVAQISAAVEETRRARLTIAAHGHGTAGHPQRSASGCGHHPALHSDSLRSPDCKSQWLRAWRQARRSG